MRCPTPGASWSRKETGHRKSRRWIELILSSAGSMSTPWLFCAAVERSSAPGTGRRRSASGPEIGEAGGEGLAACLRYISSVPGPWLGGASLLTLATSPTAFAISPCIAVATAHRLNLLDGQRDGRGTCIAGSGKIMHRDPSRSRTPGPYPRSERVWNSTGSRGKSFSSQRSNQKIPTREYSLRFRLVIV